ncbi:MAG: hypothetical protein LRZ88_00935 [Candidatus Cloacimonetes bacterium]|nr:hypothetical protein [Candidatus Cloacimonadota bacterium]
MQYFIALVFALLLSVYYYHRTQPELSGQRRILLASLRFVMLFILFMILLSPILYFTLRHRDAPKVLFLQDSSRSMELTRDGRSKRDFLKGMADTLNKKYKDAGYKVISHSFANGLEGADDNSLLAKALRELSEKEKLSDYQAIVLASDGWLRDEEYGIISRWEFPSTLWPIPPSGSYLIWR